MKKAILISICIIILAFICLKNESLSFYFHTFSADEILTDTDPLHLRLAYFENGQLIGIKEDNNPEWGNSKVYYYFNKGIFSEKIMIDSYYTPNDHHKDSTFIISAQPSQRKIFNSIFSRPIYEIPYHLSEMNNEIAQLKLAIQKWEKL